MPIGVNPYNPCRSGDSSTAAATAAQQRPHPSTPPPHLASKQSINQSSKQAIYQTIKQVYKALFGGGLKKRYDRERQEFLEIA